jgi:hypothetical protein
MATTGMQIVRGLADQTPDLASLFAEHKADNNGEVLPHVFMGDVTRWVVSLAGDSRRKTKLRRVLDFLNAEFERSDEAGRELIAVSFLENLPRPGDPGGELRNMLGAALEGELRRLGS